MRTDQRAINRTRLSRFWRDLLKPPVDVPPDQWAEQNIILSPRETKFPGSLRLDFTPYLRRIINTIVEPGVEKISLCFARQTGKTLSELVIVTYSIKNRSIPILFGISVTTLADYFVRERLEPIIESCEAIRELKLPERRDDTKNTKRFSTCTITVTGAQSPRVAKSRPIGLCFLDEIDDFKGEANGQAGVLSQFRNTVKSFPNGKVYQSSTPTTEVGNIWREFLAGSQHYYHVPCPHCGTEQKLHFSQDSVKWDEDARLENGDWDVDRVRDSTYYVCVRCKGRIEDRHKYDMLLKGQWLPENPASTRHLSFHLNSLYANSLTFGRVAQEFVSSCKHADLLRDFRISWLAEPWSIRQKEQSQSRLNKCFADYKLGTVPEPPTALVLTADYGETQCWWVIRAWSGETSWLVDYGSVPTLDGLVAVGMRTYDGHQITHRTIDHGHHGPIIDAFCQTNQGWTPTKGASDNVRSVYFWGKTAEETPLLMLRVSELKDLLENRIAAGLGKTGSWHLPSDCGDEYTFQMSGEEMQLVPNKRGFTKRVWNKIHKQNHLWDCEVYQLGVSLADGFRNAPRPTTQPAKPKPQQSQPVPLMLRPDGRDLFDFSRYGR